MSTYLLPPITSAKLHPITWRFGIEDSMLLYSSVPETPPAAYAGGTTYALDAEVSVGTPGDVLRVYRSKAAGNVGHTPASSPDWWAYLGDTYALWDGVTAWAADKQVIRVVPGTHAVYRRLATSPGASTTPPESDAERWVRVSTTARWAMFDMFQGIPTVVPSPLVIRLACGRISGLTLLKAEGSYADLGMTSVLGGGTVFDPPVESLDGTYIGSWEDYFFAPFDMRANVVRRDIPTYDDGVLTVTITSESGPVSLEKCIVGNVVLLGKLVEPPVVREQSVTTITRKFGVIEDINQQRSIPIVRGQLLCPKHQVRNARTALSNAGRAPVVVIGMDNDEDAYADLITLAAVCLDYEIDLKHKTHALISTEFEGT